MSNRIKVKKTHKLNAIVPLNIKAFHCIVKIISKCFISRLSCFPATRSRWDTPYRGCRMVPHEVKFGLPRRRDLPAIIPSPLCPLMFWNFPGKCFDSFTKKTSQGRANERLLLQEFLRSKRLRNHKFVFNDLLCS